MGRFVQIAMGSGSELSYHLLLSKDLEFLNNEQYAELTSRLERVMKMLSAFSSRVERYVGGLGLWPKANSQEPAA
jgi:four helix bundle protein